MRVNRRFLYWGVFLVALGGAVVVANLAAVDDSVISPALGLWPLILVAIGLAIVLRRTPYSLPAWLVAAALPGLALGGVFAVGPHIGLDCGSGEPSAFEHQQGAFSGSSRVDVTTGCGTLTVDTAAGSSWQLDTANTRDLGATVSSTASSLSVTTGRRGGWFGAANGRDVWRLMLPTSRIDDLNLDINAGEGSLDLGGAQIGSLELTANAAHATADLSGAAIDNLTTELNAGALVGRPAGRPGSQRIDPGQRRIAQGLCPGRPGRARCP